MSSNDRSLKLISIFLVGVVLFNFPLVSLFSQDGLFLGLPKLYWYFFTIWAGMIFFTARVVRPAKVKKD
ncbi:MAG: hypothetical protein HRU12_14700 [Phaeodactylibacter sp.]|nr:hypothetical protein [Phaeodactylibacter sp.]